MATQPVVIDGQQYDPFYLAKGRAIREYREALAAKAEAYKNAEWQRARSLTDGFFRLFNAQPPDLDHDRFEAFGETVIYTENSSSHLGFAYKCPVCEKEHVFLVNSLFDAGRYFEEKEQIIADCPDRQPDAKIKLLDALQEFMAQNA